MKGQQELIERMDGRRWTIEMGDYGRTGVETKGNNWME